MKVQNMSMCRTQPVEMSSIFRGIIDADDLGTLRQASTMDAALRAGLPVPGQAPSLAAASSSYDTDKHKVLWIVPTNVLWETAGIQPPKGKGKLLKGKGAKGAKGAKDIKGQGKGKGSPESEPWGSARRTLQQPHMPAPTFAAEQKGKPALNPEVVERIWQAGVLVLAVSAPRNELARFKVKFAPDVPPDFSRQDATCFVLDWIGN